MADGRQPRQQITTASLFELLLAVHPDGLTLDVPVHVRNHLPEGHDGILHLFPEGCTDASKALAAFLDLSFFRCHRPGRRGGCRGKLPMPCSA